MTNTNKPEDKKVNFLPEGFEKLKTEKKYWKLSQFEQGENRIRIVSRPIAGWVDWEGNKPHRYRPDEKPKTSFDPTKPMRPFWSCYVWDYKRQDLFILDITQSGIIKSLSSFGSDEDWGDFTKYDLKIKKEGNGKDTRYSATPLPHKPLTKEIETALAASPVRLEALYENKDPWTDLDSSIVTRAESEEKKISVITSEQVREIKEVLKVVGPDVLPKWLAWQKVDSIEKIASDQFERAIKGLKDQVTKAKAA